MKNTRNFCRITIYTSCTLAYNDLAKPDMAAEKNYRREKIN